MIIEDCIQGSDEWLVLRLGVVTASNFGKVLTGGQGKTRLSYMRQLRDELITGRKEQLHWSAAMERGSELEPLARKAYEEHSGHNVNEVGFIFKCSQRRVGGSPDGLINDHGGLEIKCPLPGTHDKYLHTGKIPRAYMAQIQGCMWLTGRTWWDFVSFCPEFPEDRRLLIRRVERDTSFINHMAKAIEGFVQELDQITKQQQIYYERKSA